MKAPQEQYLVFTGLDGAIFDPELSCLQKILPALELLHSREIPLILSTVQTAQTILPFVRALDHHDPFIIERGAAVYVPSNAFKTDFKYQTIQDEFKVIQLGLERAGIVEKIRSLREDLGIPIFGYSELSETSLPAGSELNADEITRTRTFQYSEPVWLQGGTEDFEDVARKALEAGLRLCPWGRNFIVTGDHDEGSAVLFVAQLYREEFPHKSIVSIGLCDTAQNAQMLYAVDIPVLIRKGDGKFDEQVGRRGMRFTREAGADGWNKAVIALITRDPEA
jgi:predicted mannosyl-3-phosphoglycerate phosphatase (HAD superfamily)